MNRTIKIKLVQPTTQKLNFVKLVKDCSGLGLKDAKDLCDNIHGFPERTFEMPIRDWETYDYSTGATTPAKIDYRKKFIDEIKNIDGKFLVNGGTQWDRNIKMMKLGISDKSDYTDFLKEYILNKFGDSEEILNFVLQKFSKEDLQEIFNKINIEL